jgi:hypothetical protein
VNHFFSSGQAAPLLSRRDALRRSGVVAAAALTTLATSGCRPAAETAPPPETTTSTVPLRVLLVGAGVSADALTRAWSAFDPSPIKIQIVDVARNDARSLSDALLTRADKTDVLIYPLCAAAELVKHQHLISLDLDSFLSAETNDIELPPAIRVAATHFAEQNIGIPLGGAVPAVFSVDELEPLGSWQVYDALVAETWGGAAGEPTAAGWAGEMFLQRAMAVSSEGWLFDSDSFDPLVTTPPYLQTLTQMAETHARYKTPRMSPQAIWTGLQDGTLRGGITVPSTSAEAFPDVRVLSMPGEGEVQRLLLDGFTPLAGISNACRQSAFARRFLNWLSTDDGSRAASGSVSGVKQVFTPMQFAADTAGSLSPYDVWLHSQWQTPLTLPCLQILNSGGYYTVLDHAIGEVLDNRSDAQTALQHVAQAWQELTEAIGRKSQLRTWNQAQGRRG